MRDYKPIIRHFTEQNLKTIFLPVIAFLICLAGVLFYTSEVSAGVPDNNSQQNKPASGNEKFTHLNKKKMGGATCGNCHNPHGEYAPAMIDSPEKVCLECHSSSGVAEGRSQSDIISLLSRRSAHPVLLTAKFHTGEEELPEDDPAMPRHVSCMDCHNHHKTMPDDKLGERKGFDINGIKKIKAGKESEICYNCHSDSENLPLDASNIRLKFAPSNESYHPVEKGSKRSSPSLISSVVKGNRLRCSDCHTPHGSDYPPLLNANYDTKDDATESPYAYALCYYCHDRNSILSNQSFKGSLTKDFGHGEHIQKERTSCYTCHDSHGSQVNPHLIAFNPEVVTGPAQYIDMLGGRANCSLTCHGKEHNVEVVE